MSRIENAQEAIRALNPEELAELRAWFAGYDWATWDRQLERDVEGGRLDELAGEALDDHRTGQTAPL